MLGQVFALWRTSDGKPICMDAFCIHLGEFTSILNIASPILFNYVQVRTLQAMLMVREQRLLPGTIFFDLIIMYIFL
jgi:hypothetical protein